MTATSRRLRSREWFDIPGDPSATATHIERYTNFGISAAELRSGNPIIGIAQTGSDLVPCNRIHVDLVRRIRDGIREAGGIALEFPVHPVQESGKRPTAALDRNLQYLSLVEVLFGYPLDGVVLTTGCDKTTPACIMAAATADLPAIVLSGGPMLDGHWEGQLVGSGTIVWEARRQLAAGEIDLGLSNHYYLLRFKKADPEFPVEQTFFEPGDAGNLVNVAGIGHLKTSQNPEQSLAFIQYLLSFTAQQFFVSEVFEYPISNEVVPNLKLLPLGELLRCSPNLNLDDLDDLDGTLKLLRRVGIL